MIAKLHIIRHTSLWISIAIVTLGLMLLWMAVPHEKLLLKQSRKVHELSGWSGATRNYVWLSETEVLLYGNENFSGEAISALAYNTQTGSLKSSSVWQKCLQERQDKYNTFWISPDGIWLLYSDYYAGTLKASTRDRHSHLSWHSSLWNRLNGRSLYRCVGWYGIHWLPDSHRWVQPTFGSDGAAKYLVVRNVHDARALTKIVIPESCKLLFGEQEFDTVFLSATHMVVRFSMDNETSGISPGALVLYEADLSQAKPPHKWTIPIPAEWQVQEVHISPDAKHLAWVVHTRYLRWSARLLQHLKLLPDVATPANTSLFVSDIYGTGFKEIGHVPTPSNPITDLEVKWLPDAKSISFVYEHILYKCSSD